MDIINENITKGRPDSLNSASCDIFMENTSGNSLQHAVTLSMTTLDRETENMKSTETITFLPIVTSSKTEQVLTASLLFTCWIYINLTNVFLLHVIRHKPRLHIPQYSVLASYMICDLLYINSTLSGMIILVIANDTSTLPIGLCRVFGSVGSGAFFTMAHTVGYMAYERFSQLFHPLTYNRYFSFKIICIVTLVLHLFGQGYALMVLMIAGRELVTTGLNCQPLVTSLQIINPITTCIFFIPPTVVSFVVLIRLRLLISRHQAQVAALNLGTEGIELEKKRKKHVITVKKAIKMIALISGAFLGTTAPFVLMRVAIFSSGVTWLETDAREDVGIFALTRLSYFSVAILSSLINPPIYLYAQNDLKRSALECCGIMKISSSDLDSTHLGGPSAM